MEDTPAWVHEKFEKFLEDVMAKLDKDQLDLLDGAAVLLKLGVTITGVGLGVLPDHYHDELLAALPDNVRRAATLTSRAAVLTDAMGAQEESPDA